MAQSTQSGKQVGDKLKSHGPENRGASRGQVGNKSQLHGPGRPDRVATQSVAGDKWGQKWGNKWGDKWQQVGDKLTPHGPKHPEWEDKLKSKSHGPGHRSKWETSGRQV